MRSKTLRERLSDAWWDITHPIVTFQRNIAVRYCVREELEMVHTIRHPMAAHHD